MEFGIFIFILIIVRWWLFFKAKDRFINAIKDHKHFV